MSSGEPLCSVPYFLSSAKYVAEFFVGIMLVSCNTVFVQGHLKFGVFLCCFSEHDEL